MNLGQIVEEHGVPVKVSCGKPSYPPFTVIRDLGQGWFEVEYGSGETSRVCDCKHINDYEVVTSDEEEK